MSDWLIALAVLVVSLALLPRMLRRSKASARKVGGGSGVMVGIGLAFAMVFDPKLRQTMEIVDKKNHSGDSEDGESGDRPEA